jgi:arsenate reductase
MAEGLLRHLGQGQLEVESAGSKPSLVRPEAVAAMAEIGIDISGHRSKHVDEFSGQAFDVVLTVCDHAREVCPIFPEATRMIHRSFPDPAQAEGDFEQRLAAFRQVRDEMRAYFESAYFESAGWKVPAR